MADARALVLIVAFALVACGESATPEPATAPLGTVPLGTVPLGTVPLGTVPGAEPEPTGAPGEPSMGADPAAPAPAPDPAVAATFCERARACCAAYVAAIPSARRPLEERACAEIDRVIGEAGEATEDACEAALGGWRRSLLVTGLEVPPSCLE